MLMFFKINYVLKHTIREPRPRPPNGARDEWKLWEQVWFHSSKRLNEPFVYSGLDFSSSCT